VVPKDTEDDVKRSLMKLVSMAMCYLTEDHDRLIDLMYEFECAPPADVDVEVFIKWAQSCLVLSREKTAEISFDQMVYVAAYFGWKTGYYDFVFVDETQDMNIAQLTLAKAALKPNGRLIAVGDPRQAIYSFRGADSNSIDNIIKDLNAKVMPLSVTYRCPRAVVNLAKSIVPDLEAAPNAIEGAVIETSEAEFLKNVKGGDFVLSRVNAPLVKYCMKMLAMGRPAFIQGKELGLGLISLIKKSKKPGIIEFMEWLQKYKEREAERLTAAGKEAQLDALHDKVEVLVTLSEDLTTTAELQYRLNDLFKDDKAGHRIMFSSVHKAKGKETHRVWCLHPTFREGKSTEEDNLCYVAWTRAMETLYLVNAPLKKKTEEQL
jgi:DNA helicase-2/ATP-dependent DNA helicase PcrA